MALVASLRDAHRVRAALPPHCAALSPHYAPAPYCAASSLVWR